ncbi:hypothetical protein A1704_23410 [Chryseobacterium cucumeris]|uniref:hypothetical protein n=1 Tax=Chryseobacterium cucumeris TaxID=1813611 RepID=UPI0007876DFD|nr:hypothetical protein [Chryseobacterium cucumeris]KYH06632.1 hypothetical protein A1704_23410 [Chryseobacterium cucumeris]
MKSKLLILFLGLMAIMNNAQMVIGSSNVSQSAILKLDSNNKALRVPNLSVTDNADAASPIASPATGVMFYNTNSNTANDIIKGITYWGSDSKYHHQANATSTDDIIATENIPLLIFSAAVGQKATIPIGSAGGGSSTTLTLTPSEIIFDKYVGWNSSTSQYKVPSTGIYMLEFITEMSNIGNNGGTTIQEIFKGSSSLVSAFGRDNVINNRMYTTVISTQNMTLSDLMTFKYLYTANNYRIESGTINIYKYQ